MSGFSVQGIGLRLGELAWLMKENKLKIALKRLMDRVRIRGTLSFRVMVRVGNGPFDVGPSCQG